MSNTTIAFWVSVACAGLAAAAAAPPGAEPWRIGCLVCACVLPLIFVKQLHSENASGIAQLKDPKAGP